MKAPENMLNRGGLSGARSRDLRIKRPSPKLHFTPGKQCSPSHGVPGREPSVNQALIFRALVAGKGRTVRGEPEERRRRSVQVGCVS